MTVKFKCAKSSKLRRLINLPSIKDISCLLLSPHPHARLLSYTSLKLSIQQGWQEWLQGLAVHAVTPGWSATPTVPRSSQSCSISTPGHSFLSQLPFPIFAGTQYNLTVSSRQSSGWILVPFFLVFRQILPTTGLLGSQGSNGSATKKWWDDSSSRFSFLSKLLWKFPSSVF